mmetsp:Transcript_23921/g.75211  ORF Transcript_23921/g.75211 Transcript_23921/m.75211 type:complete len:263 (+) Transcript_23921:173-961(+)
MPACPALQATGASPYVPFAAGWGGQRHPQKNCLLSCAGDEPETMGPPAVTEVRTGEVDGLRLVATPGEPLRLPPTVVDTSCHGLEAGGPLTQRPAVGARLRGSVEFRGGDAVFPLRGAGDGQAPAGSAWPRPRPRGAVVGSCAVVATANARPCAWPGPATANAPQAFQFAAEELRAERSAVLAVVREAGLALQFAAKALRADRDVVVAAVQQDGLALEYASEELRADREVVREAVQVNGLALWDAAEDLKRDPGLLAVARWG